MKTILQGQKRFQQLRRRALYGVVCLSLTVSAHSQSKLPEGKGKQIVESVCTQCHSVRSITSSRFSREGWQNIVYDMISQGAPLLEEEIAEVVQYLAENFGKTKKPEEASEPSASEKVNVNKATAKELEAALELSQQEAGAIVEYREKNGSFGDWEDLKKVPGLDVKKMEVKKDRVTF